ncbi:MAG: isopentenyl-diphosphate Delta-isomerase [Bacteroidia bacterium]
MNTDYVILVDEQDNELGKMEKLQAHSEAKLHRAISVFVFNSSKELLLQKRASGKYHSANLWTNTCCSHPKPTENTADAAKRRLQEEMGIACDLKYVFNFTYLAKLENGITEHEFDHVFFGFCDDLPKLNTAEASDYKYLSLTEIETQLKQNPEQFTVWFKLIFDKVKTELSKVSF